MESVIIQCSSGDAVNTRERKVVCGFTVTLRWTDSLHSEPRSSAAYGFSKGFHSLFFYRYIYKHKIYNVHKQTLALKLFGGGLLDTTVVIHKQIENQADGVRVQFTGSSIHHHLFAVPVLHPVSACFTVYLTIFITHI